MKIELFALIGTIVALIVAAWIGSRGTRGQAGSFAYAQEAAAFAETRYFAGLDALRAISVIAVIWCHVGGPKSMQILHQGHRGVDLFFAISGFLVTTLLLREHRRRGTVSLRDFFIRRSLRIFPLYFAVLGVYCALVFLTLGGTAKGAEFWSNLPTFATYTFNWFAYLDGPRSESAIFYFAWSLATEEQFYLFWPALMLLVMWLTRRTWTPALAAALLICLQIVASGQTPSLLTAMLSSLAPSILFGVIFALLLNNRRAFDLLYPVLGSRAMAPLAVGFAIACMQFEANSIVIRFSMALLVAAVCIRGDTLLHPVLRFKPLVFVGGISYGIYLMHMLAANAVRKLLGRAEGIDVFLLTTVLVVVMAYVSYRYFEAPILRFKDRLQSRRTADAAPDPAAPVAPTQ